MTKSFLVYDSEEKATTDNNQMFYNWLKNISDQHDGTICIDPENQVIVDFDSLSFQEVLELPVFGFIKKRGVITEINGEIIPDVEEEKANIVDGYTYSCNNVNKAHSQNTWWIQKFSDYMEGVNNYTEEINDIPDEWLLPEEA